MARDDDETWLRELKQDAEQDRGTTTTGKATQRSFYRLDQEWIELAAVAVRGSALRLVCAMRIYRMCLYALKRKRPAIASREVLCDDLVSPHIRNHTIAALEQSKLIRVEHRRRGLAPVLYILVPRSSVTAD